MTRLIFAVWMALFFGACSQAIPVGTTTPHVVTEDLTAEKFLVIYAYGYMGGSAPWQLELQSDGSIWENSRKLDDAELQQAFLAFDQVRCMDICLLMQADEEDMAVRSLTDAIARLHRAALTNHVNHNSIHVYVHSKRLTELTGDSGF